MKQKALSLKYSSEAPLGGELSTYACDNGAWERYSLPLGNGFFGANVFGRTVTERIQISEPSLSNPYYTPKTVPRKGCASAGVNSFAELFFEFCHAEPTDYQRTLSLDEAIARVSYKHNGTIYTREAFTSHPDNVLAVSFNSDRAGALSFTARAVIPFLGGYSVEPGDGFSKSGSVTYENDTAIIEGEMGYHGIKYLGIMKITAKGGRV
ncbi:MAG: glycoside hydrolase N-terminal domain-containing protein, partial [Clostridia bacterium]|nr:glycoside hydrolase N-terminal domain-containing protein [Clostridia bacterium]